MLQITEAAREQLDTYFEDKEKADIRVYVASGCAGPMLALALDEKSENDTAFDANGYTFIVNEELAEQAGDMTVDVGPMGFAVASDIVFEQPAGGCGGGCSGCG